MGAFLGSRPTLFKIRFHSRKFSAAEPRSNLHQNFGPGNFRATDEVSDLASKHFYCRNLVDYSPRFNFRSKNSGLN